MKYRVKTRGDGIGTKQSMQIGRDTDAEVGVTPKKGATDGLYGRTFDTKSPAGGFPQSESPYGRSIYPRGKR